jgi:hypothetical protein
MMRCHDSTTTRRADSPGPPSTPHGPSPWLIPKAAGSPSRRPHLFSGPPTITGPTRPASRARPAVRAGARSGAYTRPGARAGGRHVTQACPSRAEPVGVSLVGGMVGYPLLEGHPWIDAFANASILSAVPWMAGASRHGRRIATRGKSHAGATDAVWPKLCLPNDPALTTPGAQPSRCHARPVACKPCTSARTPTVSSSGEEALRLFWPSLTSWPPCRLSARPRTRPFNQQTSRCHAHARCA